MEPSLPVELWAIRNKEDPETYISPADFSGSITDNAGAFCVWNSQEDATVGLGYLWGSDCLTREEWEVVCVKG